MTILASTVSVKTLADNTLRLTIDIEPNDAQQAFALFGVRGSPVVVARLTQEASIAAQRAETVAADTVSRVADEKPVGGPLARLAGMLCNNPEFVAWICGGGPHSVERAAQLIRFKCNVDSRRDIDHDPEAAALFHKRIRLPFLAWQEGRG